MTKKTLAFIDLGLTLLFWSSFLLCVSFRLLHTDNLIILFAGASILSGVRWFLFWRKLKPGIYPMSQEQVQSWRRVRAKGKLRYILIRTVISTLLLDSSILMVHAIYWLRGERTYIHNELGIIIALNFIFVISFYYIWGRWWGDVEERYQISL